MENKMTQVIFFVTLLLTPLAFCSITADLDENLFKKGDLDEDLFKKLPRESIVVEGMVYCQSCKKVGTSSLSEAEPIPLARVRVNCINHRGYVFYYKEYTANYNGYFYAKLEDFSMDHVLLDHPLTSCKVQLVSSPLESCNILTNINNGIEGTSLHHEHKRLITKDCDRVFYSAGSLAFRSAECNADGRHY